VEKNTKLPTIIAADNKTNLIIIDLEKLKKNPRLEGAKIFKHLLGIKQMSNFKHTLPKTNEDGYYTILQQLDISLDDWTKLIHILESGDPFLNGKYGVKEELINIQKTSIKLGGIPYIDNYCANINIVETPGIPEDDKKGLYQWASTTASPTSIDLNIFAKTHSSEDGWSLSKIRNNFHYYYREWEIDHNSTVSSEETHLVYPESNASYNSEEDY